MPPPLGSSFPASWPPEPDRPPLVRIPRHPPLVRIPRHPPTEEGTTPSGEGAIIGLITKTESNPFFVKMREGAQAKADELGVELRSFAGEFDGDNEGQVTAIEDLISAGAAGFMITPSDTVAIVPTIQEAREAGLVVIALDTPLDPIDAADATFATDNFRAGELIGEWAAATIENPDEARNRHARPLPRTSRPSTSCATRAS